MILFKYHYYPNTNKVVFGYQKQDEMPRSLRYDGNFASWLLFLDAFKGVTADFYRKHNHNNRENNDII